MPTKRMVPEDQLTNFIAESIKNLDIFTGEKQKHDTKPTKAQ